MRVVAEGWTDEATGGEGAEFLNELRMLLENLLGEGFVVNFGGLGETEPGGAALHEELEDVGVMELVGDEVRGGAPAEAVDVDGAAGAGIFFRKIGFGDAEANGVGIVIEKALNGGKIADGGGGEDIGLSAAGKEIASDVVAMRPHGGHVLKCGGFVIDVAGVDVGTGIEEEGGDFDGGGEVKRELAVAAASMDELRIGSEEFADAFDHAKSSSGVNVEGGAARDQVVSELGRCGIENAETAGPPLGACVDVGARVEEDVDDFAIVA